MKSKWILLLMAIVMVTIGCEHRPPEVVQKSDPAYTVMFENPPRIFANEVFAGGKAIGKITSYRTGFAGITELKLDIDTTYRHRIGTHGAFYVETGHLTYRLLTPVGEVAPPETPLPGFPSVMSLKWYRFSHLLSHINGVATAIELQRKFAWAEPLEIIL